MRVRVVIVTGTSSGLGKAIFDSLISEQVYIICIARRFLKYQEILQKKKPNTIHLIKQDLSDIDDVFLNDLLNTIQALQADEVIFINNAGVIEPLGDIGELQYSMLKNAAAVNFVIPMLLVNCLLKLYKNNGIKLTLLNISSGAANHPIVGWGAYCATKAGCKMFFDTLEKQFEDDVNISVHNIDPGVLDTKMQGKIRVVQKRSFPNLDIFIDFKRQGKLKQPNDVAEYIVREYINL